MIGKAIVAQDILKHLKELGPEEVVHDTFALTGDTRLIAKDTKNFNLSQKYPIAIELLKDSLKETQTITLPKANKDKETQELVVVQEFITPEELQPLVVVGQTLPSRSQETGMKVYDAEEAQRNKSYKWTPQDSDPNKRAQEKIESAFPNYYERLKVARNATQEEIKKAWRARVKETHPDVLQSKNLSQEEMYEAARKTDEVMLAYAVLKDEDKRVRYNARLEQELQKAQGVGYQQAYRYTPYTPSSQGSTVAETVTGFAKGKAADTAKEALAKKAAATAAGKAVGKATEKVTGKLAEKGAGFALSKIGAAIGSVVPGLGTAIGYVLGKIAGKLVVPIFKFLKRNAQKLAGAGLGFLGAGFLLGNVFLGGIGAGLIGISLAGGGPAALTASVIASLSSFFAILASLILITFIIPIIIAIIGTILVVAFMMFVINNSGYVTPFAPELAIVQNAGNLASLNIEVTKRAVAGTQFNNGPWPVTIQYEITVTALEGDLTEIVFNNAYNITQEPQVASPPSVTIPEPPDTISAGTSYTFRYTVSYPETFRDSYICDTFEVAANADGTRDTSYATACITIGRAPVITDCPSGWPFNPGRNPRYVVSQGPNATFSHRGLEAVDIAIPGYTGSNEIIHTTHAGTVVERGRSSSGALYVRIASICNGQPFTSSHWHFAVIYDAITVGTVISKGTPLGIAGNTGVCAFNPDCIPGAPGREHDHYQFGLKNSSNIRMSSPYIPISGDALEGCVGIANCSLSLP